MRAKVTKVFEYAGLATTETSNAVAGNIVGLSGFEDVDITVDEKGETITVRPYIWAAVRRAAERLAEPLRTLDPEVRRYWRANLAKVYRDAADPDSLM